MTNLKKIINQLKETQQQQIKIDAQIFGLAAVATELNQELLNCVEPEDKVLAASAKTPITKEDCLKQFGSYAATYQVYKEKYGISCKTGWKYLLPLIQNLDIHPSPPPSNLSQSILAKIQELVRTEKIKEKILLDFACFVLDKSEI